MKMRRLAGVIAALSLGVAAALPALAADPIRIALIDPLSGPFSETGIGILKEFQFRRRGDQQGRRRAGQEA